MDGVQEKRKQHRRFRHVLGWLGNKENKGIPTNEKKTLKDFIKLADDEVIVKDYHAATVKKPSYGEARFAVTNKRLIMYLWTEETIKVNGVNIRDVVSTAIYRTEDSFAIIINIKAATGALSFYSYPRNILESGLQPEKLDLKTAPGPDMNDMARELGALILNMRKVS